MSEIAKIKGFDIRDKKLADATSQNSVASTDSIRMKTTGGDEVYITRDSFVDAIAAVFKSNSKSTITTLFGEVTSNNTSSIGSINMGNLASVLGGELFKFVDNFNLADLPVGVYSYPSAGRVTGLPSNISGTLHAGVIIRFNYRTNVYGAIVFDLEAPAGAVTRNGTDWITIV